MSDEPADNGASDRHIPLEPIDPLSLDDALSIVGEHTRARIIVELGRARSTDPAVSNALEFSALMERTGVRDSGRFNYHLDKLVGPFVNKAADGYALRYPGQLVYEAIVAGTLTERRQIEPFPVGDCPRCGGALEAAYHPDHLLTVECTDCETLYDAAHFPARGIEDRSPAALLDAAYQRRHHNVATMRRGVCFACGAVVDRSLTPAAEITYGTASVEEMAGLDTYAVLECTGCGSSLVGHPANIALTTPAVTGLFADHGQDVALARWWEPPVVGAREGCEIRERDPRSVAVPFALADDRLRVVLDESLQVTDVERLPPPE